MKKVEMNDVDLSANHRNIYILKKRQGDNNVLKVTLVEAFKENDKINVSLDDGYSWINISSVFKVGMIGSKFELVAVAEAVNYM